MKNIIVVTGGAGFIGSNLIKYLITKTKYKIISIDNYSTGKKSNHIKTKRVKYFNCENKDISKALKKYKNKILTVFHFGEFSRIYMSFKFIDQCYNSNMLGTFNVVKFCSENKFLYKDLRLFSIYGKWEKKHRLVYGAILKAITKKDTPTNKSFLFSFSRNNAGIVNNEIQNKLNP